MPATTFQFESSDGETITAFRWDTAGEPRAIVQVAHGMGEHAARYGRLADALNAAGYVVYAEDHRGHGQTAGGPERHGDFGPGGWLGLVDDLGTLAGVARKEHPGLPLVLLGHSMGSFALQRFLLERSEELDAAVLSGSTAVDVIAAGIDPDAPADLTAFNAPFAPARTEYDWLSRDPAEVDLYVADPACGFGVNVAGMRQMMANAADLADPDKLAGIKSDLPLLIFSGDADPIAGGGALIDMLADRYRTAGMTDVTLKLYPGARHETLNETNRDEVTADVIAWLDRVT